MQATECGVLGQTFGGSSLVSVATVDAEAYIELAEEQNVRGFPTIKYYPGSGAGAMLGTLLHRSCGYCHDSCTC